MLQKYIEDDCRQHKFFLRFFSPDKVSCDMMTGANSKTEWSHFSRSAFQKAQRHKDLLRSKLASLELFGALFCITAFSHSDFWPHFVDIFVDHHKFWNTRISEKSLRNMLLHCHLSSAEQTDVAAIVQARIMEDDLHNTSLDVMTAEEELIERDTLREIQTLIARIQH